MKLILLLIFPQVYLILFGSSQKTWNYEWHQNRMPHSTPTHTTISAYYDCSISMYDDRIIYHNYDIQPNLFQDYGLMFHWRPPCVQSLPLPLKHSFLITLQMACSSLFFFFFDSMKSCDILINFFPPQGSVLGWQTADCLQIFIATKFPYSCLPKSYPCGLKPLRDYAHHNIVIPTFDRLGLIMPSIIILIGDRQGPVTMAI
jgi:hypothetical protein